MKIRNFLACWVGVALLLAAAARACPIPVYQYAHEHWPADPYEITVFRDGTLSADSRAALDLLEKAARGEGMTVNLNLHVQESEKDANPPDPPTASFEVRYPRVSRIARPVWTGELTLDHVRALLQSPLRHTLGEALLRRTSAVWIFLESGKADVDGPLIELLETELKRIEQSAVVPETADWGGEAVTIDHQVNFSILRVRRDDPAERMLVRMLLATEPDLATDFDDAPMVFPIYGRGLVLYALVNRGINAWTLREAAEFLIGPCSCQIKADNPGTDLLMDVDWASRIRPMSPASVGGTTGTGAFLQHLDQAEEAAD